MSAEDLEKYETDMELSLYREYRDIVAQFSYVVETERRFYLANTVDVAVRNARDARAGRTVEVTSSSAMVDDGAMSSVLSPSLSAAPGELR